MTNVDWVILGLIAYGIVALALGLLIGAVIKRGEAERRAVERLRVEHERARRNHAAKLREVGRVHDVREDASGPPAVNGRVQVLGTSPRHRPPTRM